MGLSDKLLIGTALAIGHHWRNGQIKTDVAVKFVHINEVQEGRSVLEVLGDAGETQFVVVVKLNLPMGERSTGTRAGPSCFRFANLVLQTGKGSDSTSSPKQKAEVDL